METEYRIQDAYKDAGKTILSLRSLELGRWFVIAIEEKYGNVECNIVREGVEREIIIDNDTGLATFHIDRFPVYMQGIPQYKVSHSSGEIIDRIDTFALLTMTTAAWEACVELNEKARAQA